MTETSDINLFIEGSHVPQGISCPILDPTASIQITDDLIHVYQSRIDSLIDQLGKNILLEFDSILEACPNCFFDAIVKRSNGIYKTGGPISFPRGQKCPYCKGNGVLTRVVNKCIKCLIQWRPHVAKNYGISVSDPFGIVRFKGFLTDAPDMIKAKTAIANYDVEDSLKLKVRLIKGPIVIGLREERYCITFWQLIDS